MADRNRTPPFSESAEADALTGGSPAEVPGTGGWGEGLPRNLEAEFCGRGPLLSPLSCASGLSDTLSCFSWYAGQGSSQRRRPCASHWDADNEQHVIHARALPGRNYTVIGLPRYSAIMGGYHGSYRRPSRSGL
jgi:hypothetical protein